MSANTQLSNQNCPSTSRPNFLNQEFNVDNFSNAELVATSVPSKTHKFEDLAANDLFDLLTTKAEKISHKKKETKKALQIDIAK